MDSIDAFYPSQFPESGPFKRAIKLLEATHSLSFYSLKLHHGMPFQPVNIRAHQDPISLIGKVLEQNTRSYTKLDDLLDIGRSLVAAGLPSSKRNGGDEEGDEEERLRRVEMRITGMAIEAALAEDDFETAYSYVSSRIAPELVRISGEQGGEAAEAMTQGPLRDDTAWRAAFQAGRYRPTRPGRSGATAGWEIRAQEMRMELLSQALLLAPPPALPEILGVWRRCEEELNVLLARETEAEVDWDDQGDQKIPGQFITAAPVVPRDGSRLGAAEEAPVGLFDVARGAAAALRKSAFPLQGPGGAGHATSDRHASGHSRPLSGVSAEGSDAGSDEARVRKRDMVSSMVTGGLASGIGWVIGERDRILTSPTDRAGAPPAHGNE